MGTKLYIDFSSAQPDSDNFVAKLTALKAEIGEKGLRHGGGDDADGGGGQAAAAFAEKLKTMVDSGAAEGGGGGRAPAEDEDSSGGQALRVQQSPRMGSTQATGVGSPRGPLPRPQCRLAGQPVGAVMQWLHDIGLGAYAAAAEEEEIDGDALAELCYWRLAATELHSFSTSLAALGMTKTGHVLRFSRALHDLCK